MTVRSLPEKPIRAAISLPCWRAAMISASWLMAMLTSSAMFAIPGDATEKEVNAFLEIERGLHAFQSEAQLHQGERHFRLDADHHRFGPPQLGDMGDAPQGADGEGIHDVEGGDI